MQDEQTAVGTVLATTTTIMSDEDLIRRVRLKKASETGVIAPAEEQTETMQDEIKTARVHLKTEPPSF